MTTLAHLPRLGVGVMYNPALPEFLQTDLDALDYIEITSDMFWTDRGPGAQPRYEELESWTDMLKWMRERRPVVAHNIGLSIGNAGRFDLEYAAHLGEWQRRYDFAWQSDHLSFAEVTSADGADQHAGVAVPLPYDEEVLDLIVERVNRVQEIASIPLLLENSVYFVNFRDQDMSEPQFLNALTARTGCGILLDLHNLYCNARNHGFDAFAFLDELDLTRVVEAHIAGGTEFAGMYTDSHSGACPEEVWRLLESLVPRAPNLRGVTFEFHDSYYGRIQREGVRAQIERAREVFQ